MWIVIVMQIDVGVLIGLVLQLEDDSLLLPGIGARGFYGVED